jgi:hypothetical protein
MAGFRTHITVSTLAGVGYGAAAYAFYNVPAPACILAGGLCGVSGMLPDIDSGPGRPLRESLAFAAAVISTMLVDRFQQFGLSMESIILAGAFIYLLIRFGLAELLRLYTVHRGMFHSIPAAIIFGELEYLLASGDMRLRLYKAGGVVLGYMIHLVLDEMYSVYYVRGRMQIKKSFGTAIKLFDRKKLWPNVSAYAKLAAFTFLALQDQSWMGNFYHSRLQAGTEHLTQKLVEYSGKTLTDSPTASLAQEPAKDASPDEIQANADDPSQRLAPISRDNSVGSRAGKGSGATDATRSRW